jgi:hypothetical protein
MLPGDGIVAGRFPLGQLVITRAAAGRLTPEEIADGIARHTPPPPPHRLDEVPATFGLEGGFWFPVRHGIRALLVADERQMALAYMVCEEASQYYRAMTECRRMPVLIRESW